MAGPWPFWAWLAEQCTGSKIDNALQIANENIADQPFRKRPSVAGKSTDYCGHHPLPFKVGLYAPTCACLSIGLRLREDANAARLSKHLTAHHVPEAVEQTGLFHASQSPVFPDPRRFGQGPASQSRGYTTALMDRVIRHALKIPQHPIAAKQQLIAIRKIVRMARYRLLRRGARCPPPAIPTTALALFALAILHLRRDKGRAFQASSPKLSYPVRSFAPGFF